ncbi:MAG: GxxExxY protein [Gammaproteobacteria bacterium]
MILKGLEMVKGKTISQQVISCAFEVSNRLGAGFLESVYENALCIELEQQGIDFQQQVPISVEYKDQIVGIYVADLIVGNKILVELKALSEFSRTHDAQVMNYLKATGIHVGLLLNFGTPKLGIRRIAWQYNEAEGI